MPHLHVVDFIARTSYRANDSIDAVTGKSKDSANAPFIQSLDQIIADGSAHIGAFLIEQQR